ncbi:hypothetical protein VI817_004992 [Penicillium citrinum]|nr:hypothetical protein VI817_004992 [Penicillium citrinum]
MPTSTSTSSDQDEQHAELAVPPASIPIDSTTTISDMKESSLSMIARLESIEKQIGAFKSDLICLQGAGQHDILRVDTTTSLPVVADNPVVYAETRHKSPGRRFVEDATGATIYLGSHSDFPLALGCREPQPAWDDLFSETMMDRFSPRAYPFTNLWGPEATTQDVCKSLPGDADILL